MIYLENTHAHARTTPPKTYTPIANARRAKLQLSRAGIPPTVNLRGLLRCLGWCLCDGLVAWGSGAQAADGK